MRNRYTAQLVQRDRHGYSWVVTQSRSFKNIEPARRWLERKVPDFICSRQTYHRDRARADYGDIHDDKRGRVIETVEGEARVMPSVGELGVTP